MLQY